MSILTPVIIFVLISIAFGFLLGFANDKFKLEIDERIPLVRECLPSANCGGCGFAGCDAYAAAIVNEGEKMTKCLPGGQDSISKISRIMGVESEKVEQQVAFVQCNGSKENAKENYIYQGIMDCSQALIIPGKGSKACEYSCMGFGNCVKVCAFDAIRIENGVAVIDEEKCTACGSCANACPKGIIKLFPKKSRVRVRCSSKAKGKEVLDACLTGCIGCSLCEKTCSSHVKAIIMKDNLPEYDYDKCDSCTSCVKKCPKKSIYIVK